MPRWRTLMGINDICRGQLSDTQMKFANKTSTPNLGKAL